MGKRLEEEKGLPVGPLDWARMAVRAGRWLISSSSDWAGRPLKGGRETLLMGGETGNKGEVSERDSSYW